MEIDDGGGFAALANAVYWTQDELESGDFKRLIPGLIDVGFLCAEISCISNSMKRSVNSIEKHVIAKVSQIDTLCFLSFIFSQSQFYIICTFQ